ncbi:LTA synthase family protein [Gordoniibacillus kamchatkensis]|uniref:LTA synthase family protein n=1 Tax=Gordoniibacillus kamchatkensis TaxID=1590651 RepID=UPI000697F914|nr:LTA synthase family protein [Paenibacillus sp. VKM B-2647]
MRRTIVRVLDYSWSWLSLAGLGLGFWLLTEGLARNSLTYAADWAVHHGWHFALNAGLVFAFFLMIAALAGRVRPGFWLFAALLVPLALANALKTNALGFPLFPWDVVLGTDEFTWFGLLRHFTWKMALLAGGFLLAAGLLLHLVPWYWRKLGYMERIALAVLAIVIWGSVYNDRPFPLQHTAGVTTTPWDPIGSYDDNGFLLSTMLNAPFVAVDKPTGYGKQAVTSLLAGEKPRAGSAAEQSSAGAGAAPGQAVNDRSTKPNLIVILSEAFWDPTIVPGLKFSEDPLPTLHGLWKRYPGGWLQTPQFGGGTANVEFEVLTSLSMRFLREDSLPYVNYVNRGVDSLASILTRQGYEATAINPLDSWFFVSRKAYRNMGFGRYVSSEFMEPVREGMFIADSEVAKTIIRETERTPGPDMVFANTMENHYPFFPGKFKQNTIRVDGPFPAGTKGILETYAQGIHAADAMLKQLVDYYSASKEPTMIVYFGDHMPALDSEEKVYRNIGWVKGAGDDEDPEYWRKMYRTPFVVWDNFLPHDAEAQPEQLLMSPSFLGPYALRRAGLAGTAFTDYVGTLAQSVPVIPPRKHYADLGVREEQLTGYRQLEYDALFGQRYAYAAEGIGGSIVPPVFRLGDTVPSIASAAAEPAAGGSAAPGSVTLTVRGSGFAPAAAVYAGGRALDTARIDGATLRAVLPGGARPAGGKPLPVQVKIVDSKGFTLQTSNEVTVDLP